MGVPTVPEISSDRAEAVFTRVVAVSDTLRSVGSRTDGYIASGRRGEVILDSVVASSDSMRAALSHSNDLPADFDSS